MKAEAIIEAFSSAGWDIFLPGEADLAFGWSGLQELFDGRDVTMLGGNLHCEGGPELPASAVVERGGRRVGVVGVVGGDYQGCEVGDPVEAARAGIAQMGEVDVTLALVHAPSEVAQAVAEAIEPDFLINGHTGTSMGSPRQRSAWWSLGAGSKGKRLGLLSLDWGDGGSGWEWSGGSSRVAGQLDRYTGRLETARGELEEARESGQPQAVVEQRETRVAFYAEQVERLRGELEAIVGEGAASNHFTHELRELGPEIADDPEIAGLVERAKESIAQAATGAVSASNHSSGPFAGSGACQGCHVEQYQQWLTTDHATAWDSLVEGGRELDGDCYSCHSTGAHHPAGPGSALEVGALKGVGCESCHGPARAHLLDPNGEIPIGLTAEVPVSRCRECHDGERDDGDFNEVEYLERVHH